MVELLSEPVIKASATEVIDETEGDAPVEPLRDTATQEDATADGATGRNLRELAKEAGPEEVDKTEGEAHAELLRVTTAQEDVTAAAAAGHDQMELARDAGLEDVIRRSQRLKYKTKKVKSSRCAHCYD